MCVLVNDQFSRVSKCRLVAVTQYLTQYMQIHKHMCTQAHYTNHACMIAAVNMKGTSHGV